MMTIRRSYDSRTRRFGAPRKSTSSEPWAVFEKLREQYQAARTRQIIVALTTVRYVPRETPFTIQAPKAGSECKQRSVRHRGNLTFPNGRL